MRVPRGWRWLTLDIRNHQNDARIPERGEALSSKRLPQPFVIISIPATEVQPDATGEPVSFYRMDVMSDSRGTSMHKRFSYVAWAWAWHSWHVWATRFLHAPNPYAPRVRCVRQ